MKVSVSSRGRRVYQCPLSERWYLRTCGPGQWLPVSVCTWLYKRAVSDRYVIVEIIKSLRRLSLSFISWIVLYMISSVHSVVWVFFSDVHQRNFFSVLCFFLCALGLGLPWMGASEVFNKSSLFNPCRRVIYR